MILTIYTIYDKKSGVHLRPFFSANEDTAVREIAQEMFGNVNSQLRLFAEDFDLYEHGTWDDQTGEWKTHPPAGVLSLYECKVNVEGYEENNHGPAVSDEARIQ